MPRLPRARNHPPRDEEKVKEVRAIFDAKGNYFDLLIIRDAGLGDIIYTSVVIEALYRVFSTSGTTVRITLATQRPYYDYLKRLPFLHSCIPLEVSPVHVDNYTLAINLCRTVDFLPDCDKGHRLDLLASKSGLKEGDLNYKWRAKLLPEEITFSRRLRKFGRGRKIVGLSPSSASHIRTWDGAEELVPMLVDSGYHVFYIERDKNPIFDSLSHITNLSGMLTVSQLIGAVDACDCVISSDSGPMHVCGIFEKPFIAFFGPIDPDYRLRYYTPPYKVLFPDGLACAPCWDWQKRHCDGSAHYKMCMRLIPPSLVLNAVKTLIG